MWAKDAKNGRKLEILRVGFWGLCFRGASGLEDCPDLWASKNERFGFLRIGMLQ